MTEVYINDILAELEDEEVITASYGNITFGTLGKRKGVKSNTWKLPFSQQNKLIYEGSEVQGSYSTKPYRKGTVRVEIEGVIVFEGWCVLNEAKESYEVQSFGGASDFYSVVTNSKLRDLDLSEFNHVWNESNIRNSWANIEGYTYAFVEYGKNWPSFYNFDASYLLPQIFFHTVVKQIATDAGYTLQGEVLTNPRFLTHVIIPNVFPVPIMYGGNFVLSALLPDLLQSKVWLDFANIYGLQFDINDLTGEIYANYIDDILFNESEEWTERIDYSEKPRIKYRIDNTFQTSYLKYKADTFNPAKASGDAYQDYAKSIIIDDENLPLSGDVYKSEFYLIQEAIDSNFPDNTFTTDTYSLKGNFFYGIWRVGDGYVTNGIVFYQGTYYEAQQNSTGESPPSNTDFWKPIKESDNWDIKLRPMYGRVITDVGSTKIVEFATTTQQVTRIITNFQMDWDYTFEQHYRLFERIIQRTKAVESLVKLRYADVNQLDFTKAKRIDNELYVLEEVKQFKLNRNESTLVDLIRI